MSSSGHALPTRGADGVPLPHPPQNRRRGHGRGVRGGRPEARSPRRPEVPSRRPRQRRTSPPPFPAGGQGRVLPEPPASALAQKLPTGRGGIKDVTQKGGGVGFWRGAGMPKPQRTKNGEQADSTKSPLN